MLKYFDVKMIKMLDDKYISKEDVLKKMVENICHNSDFILDKEVFYEAVLEREKIGSTAIGVGVAIPHARVEVVKKIIVSIYILKNPIDFNSLDGEKVKIVILVAAPKEESKKYLELLSSLSKMFRNKKNRESILECSTSESLIKAVQELS
ncbi:MAG: PTS sugar transporter subunit IIA [Cetobacterium sp.]|uniref:PTS sugar transporter subunit IIA n=1 Tax=Cetobacterium sp. TaxID=2071632 RepID=UPI003F2A678B